jgi:signal transduction histidine kinase
MTAAAVSAVAEPGRARRETAVVALGVACLALVAIGFGLGVYLPNLHNGLIAAAFTAVGVLVLARRPGNREGWLFVATGLAHAVMFTGRQYGLAAADGEAPPAAVWVQWVGVWPLAPVLVLVGVTFMCFPDGRLPSPRWRVVVAAMAVAGVLLALASALWPVEYTDNALSLRHPLDLGGARTAQQVWNVAGPVSYLLFQIAWVACLVVRLQRAEADEARQLRWFVYAVALSAAAVLGSAIVFGSPTPGLLTVPVVALAAGLAIVKYRLYDIDLVINKTLLVGAMAAMITAGYVAVVVGLGHLVGLDAGPSPVLALVATALVAVAFEPFRRRVQAWADQLVYGHRPTPYEALSRLSGRLSRGQNADLFGALTAAVAEGVGAAAVTLWVGSGDDLVPVASWPPRTGQSPPVPAPASLPALAAGSSHVRPIEHQGSVRGAVTLTKAPGEALSVSEARLLDDLVAQAGLVIDNVGLGVELRQRLRQISLQAAELRAAARRIVAAQDEARRRIERDLHDGAQQRLVTLALSLQSVSERAAATGNTALATQVAAARRQLSQALTELRDLARGIHPAILTQEGFDAAVGFLAERAPLPVQVELRLDRRVAPEVEATAYFVVSEALTNAAKHAQATRITVAGCLRDGQLWIEVTDDGRGGAGGLRGSGLQGLVDRLAALGGELTVTSPAGGGTRLRAVIPCA